MGETDRQTDREGRNQDTGLELETERPRELEPQLIQLPDLGLPEETPMPDPPQPSGNQPSDHLICLTAIPATY